MTLWNFSRSSMGIETIKAENQRVRGRDKEKKRQFIISGHVAFLCDTSIVRLFELGDVRVWQQTNMTNQACGTYSPSQREFQKKKERKKNTRVQEVYKPRIYFVILRHVSFFAFRHGIEMAWKKSGKFKKKKRKKKRSLYFKVCFHNVEGLKGI